MQRTSLLFASAIGIQFILLLLCSALWCVTSGFLRAAAHEIENAHARIGAILATTGDGIYQFDEQGRLVYLNPAAENLLGYKLDEIRGTIMHDLIHSRTPEGDPLADRNLPAAGRHAQRPFVQEWGRVVSAQRRNLSHRGLHQHASGGGGKYRWCGVFLSRHHGPAASGRTLRSTMALQRAIFDSAGLSIISTDAHGMITTFNPAAERMLQYQAKEVIGKATLAVIHDPDEIEQRAGN